MYEHFLERRHSQLQHVECGGRPVDLNEELVVLRLEVLRTIPRVDHRVWILTGGGLHCRVAELPRRRGCDPQLWSQCSAAGGHATALGYGGEYASFFPHILPPFSRYTSL